MSLDAERQFMDSLLAGLDASDFSLPPSQSPPKGRHRQPLVPVEPKQTWPQRDSRVTPSSSPQKRVKRYHDSQCGSPARHGILRTPRQEGTDLTLHKGDDRQAAQGSSAQDYKTYTRCRVLGVIDQAYAPVSSNALRTLPEKALVLQSDGGPSVPVRSKTTQSQASEHTTHKNGPPELMLALLRDEWLSTNVAVDDIVNLVGEFEKHGHQLPPSFALSPSESTVADHTDSRISFDAADNVLSPEKVHTAADDDTIWDDLESLPSLSQLSAQEALASAAQTRVRTMIFGSRNFSKVAETPYKSFAASLAEREHDCRDNLLILHPDILVPATKIADIASCVRKPIVQDRLKGASDVTIALLMGNMLHEVLQACLTACSGPGSQPQNLALPTCGASAPNDPHVACWPKYWTGIGDFSRAFVEQQIHVQVEANLESLYALDISTDKATSLLREQAAAFSRFADVYLARPEGDFHIKATMRDAQQRSGDNGVGMAKVRITRILDVEEEIWSPIYGLKGKVDASVECQVEESLEELVPFVGLQRPERLANRTQQHHVPPSGRASRRSTLVMPLELKTGRSELVSTEHRAQTMLYTLMMSDRYGRSVKDGLLYYSKSGDLHRVHRGRNEVRSLIIGRNELAGFLRQPREFLDPSGAIDKVQRPRSLLPATIDNDHKCRRCYAVDGCMLLRCAIERIEEPDAEMTRNNSETSAYVSDIEGAFTTGEPHLRLPQRSAIADLFAEKTGHLTQRHVTFFRKWDSLLSLEEGDVVRSRRELWTMRAEDRERSGRCFANMRLHTDEDALAALLAPLASTAAIGTQPTSTPRGHSVVMHRFCRGGIPTSQSAEARAGLLSGHIAVHDPVTVSIEPNMLSVAQGFVTSLTPTSVEVSVDHTVYAAIRRVWEDSAILPSRQAIDKVVFRIDKDEMATGMGRVRFNVASLFLKQDRGGDPKRRELIVDLRPPRFVAASLAHLNSSGTENEPLKHALDLLQSDPELNADQRNAICQALCAQDYALILGMPGTGKTTTIAKLIALLVRMGKRVLLTSYTHSAVDTIVRKLSEQRQATMRILRLGNRDKVHPDAQQYLPPQCSSMEALVEAFEAPNVVATTCLGIQHAFFNAGMAKLRRSYQGSDDAHTQAERQYLFDYCIVDEASQVPLPTCLGPLRFADRFVLVGDHHQLPPLVKNVKARAGGLDVSLFKLLSDRFGDLAVSALACQYRMNSDIMSLSNALVYKGALRTGSATIASQGLDLPPADHHLSQLSKGFKNNLALAHDWIEAALNPASKVRFFDSSDLSLATVCESRQGDLVKNVFEARAVVQLILSFLAAGCSPSQIAVITPYRQQIKLLRSLLSEAAADASAPSQHASHLLQTEGVELLTADKSQGRDKDIVIITFVRANTSEGQNGQQAAALDGDQMDKNPTRAKATSDTPASGQGTGELLNDIRRLNVTLTRARKKMLFVGHATTLRTSDVLRQLLDLLDRRRWIHALKCSHL